jgi:hypothetical protein
MAETTLGILCELERLRMLDTARNSSLINPFRQTIEEKFGSQIRKDLGEIIDYSFTVNGNPDSMHETQFYEGAVSCFMRDEKIRSWAVAENERDLAPPIYYLFALSVYVKDLAKQMESLRQRGLYVMRNVA